MRPIHLVDLDKPRPALILTRPEVRSVLNQVTVAPIVSRRRGIRTEVPVGSSNGLDHDSVVNCDSIGTVAADKIGPQIGWLLASQEAALRAAIIAAFALEV